MAEKDNEKSKDNDEELSIDFGKFFKKKNKKEGAEKQESGEADRQDSEKDEIALDFSKIKSFFKKSPEESHNRQAGKQDELGLDFSKIKSFFAKHPVFIAVVLLLIMQFVPCHFNVLGMDVYAPWGGAWMRLQAEDLHQTESWANNAVTNSLRSQIAAQIEQNYPGLPDSRKKKKIEEELEKVRNEQADAYKQQVAGISAQLKERFQYEHNGRKYVYMPDIDPYQWIRYARNLVTKGHVGDEVRDGRQWDNHMVAPVGAPVPQEFHPYALAFWHRIAGVFSKNIPVMHSATFFPVFLALLSLIPAFFIGRKLGGTVGGLAAATMVSVSTAIFGRTLWGHADTDAYNVFFPILTTWLFFEAVDSKNWKKTVLWAGGLGLSFGLYAWAWPAGWWYVFDFMLITLAAMLAFDFANNFRNLRRFAEVAGQKFVFIAGILVSTGFFVTVFRSFRDFWLAPIQPVYFSVIKAAAHPTLWPNVYTTVAELNPTNIMGAINAMGGKIIPFFNISSVFVIAAIGILWLLIKRKDSKWSIDPKYGVFFAVWIIATIYAATKGVRFTLLMTPAVALCFGIALGRFYTWAVVPAGRAINVNKKIIAVILIVFFAWLYVEPIKGSLNTAHQDIPIVNDAWWDSLTEIKQKSEQDAIINSWWDFGHHFKYIADRAVTFDGASQNTPMAHWIGKTLLTDNEKQAVGILRMLDCGSNKAFEAINNQTNNTVLTISILNEMIVSGRPEAGEILEDKGIKNRELVLSLTHCEPPENYFITSHDMIGKSGVWSHFGAWNFEKAELWIKLRRWKKDRAVKHMTEKWKYTEEQAEQAYFEAKSIGSEDEANAWISPWIGIMADSRTDCEEQGDVIACANGLVVNRSGKKSVVNTAQGPAVPHSLVFVGRDGKIQDIKYNDSSSGITAIVWYAGGNKYATLFSSPELARSMFVRLYYMEGHGLEHFREFSRRDMIIGGQVIVWKVDWKGGEPNKLSSLKQKTGEASEGDLVSVNYIGWLDERIFDTSIAGWRSKNITKETNFSDFETRPLEFTIGQKMVIDGFDAAVRGMEKGDEKVVRIPPNAAYGTDPDAHPLGNKTLNFKIQLVRIQ